MDFNVIIAFVRDHIELIVGMTSAVVALFGAWISRRETRRQRQVQVERLRQEIDGASLGWGNSAIDTLNRSAMLARTREMHQNDTSFKGAQFNMAVNLSTLVDQGRMFFPNISHDTKGAEKEGAFRGSRPPILDALMFAYYEVQSLQRQGGPTGDNSAEFIEDCRRLLVSELQAHLDPRRRDEILERYDDQRESHRADALKRSNNLRASLAARRPEIKIDGERAAAATTQAETLQ